ncbi:MAG: AmmeMemoRadiSam system protein B [Dehalococcoidia bacterium]|nr:AmmeMemoRadiSam system protein B [Dehalococcoidia bacterium]
MNPRIRALDAQWIQHEGQNMLLVRDRLGISPGNLLAPEGLALLLSLMDGTRDAATLADEFHRRTGQPMDPAQIDDIIRQCDEVYLLDSPRFQQALAAATAAYRAQPDRPMFHAGAVYPTERLDAHLTLTSYAPEISTAGDTTIRGIVSPHIDYQRGGAVYGATWDAAIDSVKAADVVLIFGTDHMGGPGRITLTRLSYRTPFGRLPTDQSLVNALARAIGEEAAFAEELHHRSEHSIELAAVWLHWALAGEKPIVPILCGNFAPYTHGDADPAAERAFAALVDTLRDRLAGKRVVAVAAADLAHVGPAFGDPPVDDSGRHLLAAKDQSSIEAILTGDYDRFVGELRAERDQRKVCGLPPIYLMLRYLGATRGTLVAYDQCPADDAYTSWVSVAGALLR